MKAYHINECQIFAGADAEDAIRAALDYYGPGPRREALSFREGLIREADPEMLVGWHDEPGLPPVRLGEILASMTGPGLVCSTEY